ncbi:MAG: universal stress protein [Pseudomonadota bacterium]
MLANSLSPLGRFERILIATDGSEFSSGAAVVGLEMARIFDAKVFVVSIARSDPEYATLVPGLEEEAEAQALRNLAAVRSLAAGMDCEYLVRHAEDPYMGIVRSAEEFRADVIVMGRRGRRGLARMMVGDATVKVIGHAPCSVLVVPKAARMWQAGILVATDGSRYADAAAVNAERIAAACGLPVIVLSVTLPIHNRQRREQADAAVARVSEALTASGLHVDGLVRDGRPDQIIIETAKVHGADLIVMGSHGRTGMERVLLGSVSERVIGYAEFPVFVARS